MSDVTIVSVQADRTVVPGWTPQKTTIALSGRMGPPGAPGADGGSSVAQFIFEQLAPALTWTIVHNLGYQPHVTLIDNGGDEFESAVNHQDVNTLVVNNAHAISGTAYLS